MVAQAAVAGIGLDLVVASGTIEGNADDFADRGGGSVGHHHDAVGEEEGLIDVVRDHQHRGFLFPPDRQQFLLQLLLGDRIEGAERFIEHQHRWIDRQRPGDRHPLLHASRDLAGSLLGGVAQVHHLQVMVHHPAACCWV